MIHKSRHPPFPPPFFIFTPAYAMTSFSSLRDDKSAKSWATHQPVYSPASPASTWGTLSTTSTSSTLSLQAAIDHKTSWGSPTNTTVGSPPLYPSPSLALGNSPTYSGYSSPSPFVPSSTCPASSWTRLNPFLDSRSPRCMEFDIGYPLNHTHNINEPAVHPPASFMQVFIIVQPFKWPVNIQVHGPVSVYQVLKQLHEFLQGYQNPQDLQKSRLLPSAYNPAQSDRFREETHPDGFHSGQKRIDLLGRHRIFRGLSPEPGPNCAWVVHLSDR